MPKYEDGCYGSIAGIALIGKVLAGRCKMHYTRVAAGKGEIPEGATPKTMTTPADFVMDAKISGITNPVDGECQITVQINSANVAAGFYCTGLLLYAEDPDEGEVPFTYLVLENEPEWIRPASSIVGKLATFDIIAAVGDVDSVSANIDPESIATVDAVNRAIQEHNADPDAHQSQIAAAVAEQVKEMEESGDLVTPDLVEEAVDEKTTAAISGLIIFSALPPTTGPALWFCTDPAWRPEPDLVAIAQLGNPSGSGDADVMAEVNNIVYPVINATVSKEDGDIIATFEQS